MDPRRDEYWRRVREILSLWRDESVLDVCCGYGQFSQIFKSDRYLGIDFAEGMVRMANEFNPGRMFSVVNAREYQPQVFVDVIFEVNSLRSLGWHPEQFYGHFRPYAKKVVACLEADDFRIYQMYDK